MPEIKEVCDVTRNAPRFRIALIACIALVAVVPTALAGKPGGGGQGGSGPTSSSSITGPVMVVDNNGDGLPNWNDQVTFNVSTTATNRPYVVLNCYQSGTWVSTANAGFFPEYPWAPDFTLASGGWMSGAADCTATLYMFTSNGKTKNLTSMSFHVGA
jgi:hypothetical protein